MVSTLLSYFSFRLHTSRYFTKTPWAESYPLVCLYTKTTFQSYFTRRSRMEKNSSIVSFTRIFTGFFFICPCFFIHCFLWILFKVFFLLFHVNLLCLFFRRRRMPLNIFSAILSWGKKDIFLVHAGIRGKLYLNFFFYYFVSLLFSYLLLLISSSIFFCFFAVFFFSRVLY